MHEVKCQGFAVAVLLAISACTMAQTQRWPSFRGERACGIGDGSPLPIELKETNPLVIPIPIDAQATGRFTIHIEASQDLRLTSPDRPRLHLDDVPIAPGDFRAGQQALSVR